MLILSNVLSKVSGSLAGITGAHNRGGMYLRARSTPVNPNTAFQQAVRNFVSSVSSDWSNVLTQVQRDAWDVYVQNQLFLNKLGEAKSIPPMSAYIKTQVPRLQAGLVQVNDGPVIFTLPPFTDPSFAIVGSTGAIDVTFDNTDDWANEDDAAMLIYCSRPQSVGVNFFKGPYRFVDAIEGDALVPPTSPAAMTTVFLGGTGSKYFFRVRVTTADGRLSGDRFFSAIAT